MHDQLPDKQEDTTFSGVVTVSDTSIAWIRLQSLTTAQMNAIASPVNGDVIYNTTAWENYQYIGWAWSAVSAGSTQANASTTVAGKVEQATTAQNTAGTATWETGAPLFSTPADTATQIQSWTWTYWADAGWDDTYVVALTPTLSAYTAWQTLRAKVTTANTGACSFDFWPWAKNVKTLDGNDPQTGAIRANMVVELVYDWTNLILQSEDIASTGNKGVIEIWTTAEQLAYADTSRAVTAEWLWLAITGKPLTVTRAMNAASSTQTSAHWFSKTPKWCTAFSIIEWEPNSRSQGCSDWSTHYSVYASEEWNGGSVTQATWVSTSYAIFLKCSAGTSAGQYSQQAATITFDATNVNIVWTKTSSWTESTANAQVVLRVY
jgi:hypothetical protein